MNKERRMKIKNTIANLNRIKEQFESLRNNLDDIEGDSQEILDDEQYAYDNLPEGLMESTRGISM